MYGKLEELLSTKNYWSSVNTNAKESWYDISFKKLKFVLATNMTHLLATLWKLNLLVALFILLKILFKNIEAFSQRKTSTKNSSVITHRSLAETII